MAGLPQTFQTKVTAYDTIQRDPLGSIRFEGGKFYKYVKLLNSTNTTATDATNGTLVAYQKAANNGYLNNIVCVDVAVDADATTPFGAGAVVGVGCPGVAGTTYYLWVQIDGYVTLDTSVTTAAAGKSFTMSATNKTGTVAVAGSSVLGVSVNTTTLAVLAAPF